MVVTLVQLFHSNFFSLFSFAKEKFFFPSRRRGKREKPNGKFLSKITKIFRFDGVGYEVRSRAESCPIKLVK